MNSPTPTEDTDSRASSVLEVDGQRWELSDFFNESGQSDRLYPRLMEDESNADSAINSETVVLASFEHREAPKATKEQNMDYGPLMTENEELEHADEAVEFTKAARSEEQDVTFIKKQPPPPSMTLSRRRSQNQGSEPAVASAPVATTASPVVPANGRRPSYKRSDSGASCVSSDSRERAEEAAGLVIEICPGMEVKLRGSIETRKAIKKGFIRKASCMDCSLELGCISDAEYVLCPLCKCVSPLAFSGAVTRGAFGVGLGFQYD